MKKELIFRHGNIFSAKKSDKKCQKKGRVGYDVIEVLFDAGVITAESPGGWLSVDPDEQILTGKKAITYIFEVVGLKRGE
jgi:hypothetical protein